MLDYLYDLYGSSLYGVIFRVVKQESTAVEVLRQTFKTIWNDITFYNPKKFTLFTWMTHIALHLAKEHRHLQGTDHFQETNVVKSGMALIRELTINYGETANELLDNLLPEHRQVIELLYFEGCSYSEVIKILDLSSEVIKTRIRAALVRLSEILQI